LKASLKDNFNKFDKEGESDDGRQQYRVVHNDLMFLIQYSGH